MAMPEYDNTNKGVLFVNDKDKDTQPDYKGSINVGGQEFWLSAWIKTPRDRSKEDFLSLSVTPKDNNRQQTRNTNTSQRDDGRDFLSRTREKADKHRPPQAQSPAPDYDSFDDDIPF